MVALMGASGAGKSSLLDCISLRNQSFKGTVMINNAPVTENFFGMSGESSVPSCKMMKECSVDA